MRVDDSRDLIQKAHFARRYPTFAILALGAIVVAMWMGWWAWRKWDHQTVARLLTEANRALVQKEYATAERIACQVLEIEPSSSALLIAAQAARDQQHHEQAVRYCDRIPDREGEEYVKGLCLSGDIVLNGLHRLSDAERRFRHAFRLRPRSIMANQALAYTLNLAGRNWEARPFLNTLLHSGQFSSGELIRLSLKESDVSLPHLVQQCRDASPNDPLPVIGLAHIAMRDNQTDKAIGLLRQAISMDSRQTEPYVVLGELLAQQSDWTELVKWRVTTPPVSEERPEFWVACALYWKHHNENSASIRITRR